MGIERINPDSVYAPNNDAYSQAVKATGDTQIHLSGMVGLTQDGELVSEDMREQTAQVIKMLSNTLEDSGADTSDLVRIRILTTDAGEYLEQCHELTTDWYGEDKPASTLHEVAGLAIPELKIEIEATAILDK